MTTLEHDLLCPTYYPHLITPENCRYCYFISRTRRNQIERCISTIEAQTGRASDRLERIDWLRVDEVLETLRSLLDEESPMPDA